MLVGTPAPESEAETMKAISDLLSEHLDEAPVIPTKSARAQRPDPSLVRVQNVEARVQSPRSTSIPDAAAVKSRSFAPLTPAEPVPAPRSKSARRPAILSAVAFRLPKSMPDIHITWGHVLAVGLLAWALFNPAMFVLFAVLYVFGVVGVFLLLGPDRVWSAVDWILRRTEQRDPDKAARITAWLDGVANRWDCVLDRFPEGMVDGLYMPDFNARAEQQAQNEACLSDRLSRMHQQV